MIAFLDSLLPLYRRWIVFL